MGITLVLATAFSAVLATGCKNSNPAPSGKETAEKALSLYTNGFNRTVDELQDIFEEYFDAIPEDGPQPRKYTFLVQEQPLEESLTATEKKFQQANGQQANSQQIDGDKLATLTEQIVHSARAGLTLLTQAKTYYASDQFRKDNLAQGRTIHTQMLEQSTQFQKAVGSLEEELAKAEEQQTQRELQQHSKDTYNYWFRYHSLRAKQFVESDSNTALEKRHAALAQALKEATAYLKNHSENLTLRTGSAMETYLQQARALQDVADTVASQTKAESYEDAMANQYQTLIDRYNGLVNEANALYTLEAQEINQVGGLLGFFKNLF